MLDCEVWSWVGCGLNVVSVGPGVVFGVAVIFVCFHWIMLCCLRAFSRYLWMVCASWWVSLSCFG